MMDHVPRGKYISSSWCWDQSFAGKAKYNYKDPKLLLSMDVFHLLSFSTADNKITPKTTQAFSILFVVI